MPPYDPDASLGQAPARAPEVIYRVDAAGRLTFVNDDWDTFAALNGARGLSSGLVLGRSVVKFIAGVETQIIYERILARALTGVSLLLPYRCDSPTERRRMTLMVAQHPTGEIEFRSRALQIEAREPVSALDPQQPRGDALLTLCSWCNRGRAGDHWAEIEEVIGSLGLFDTDVPRLTHGMCPECQQRLSASLFG